MFGAMARSNPPLNVEILSESAAIAELYPEWHELYVSYGQILFQQPAWYHIWWVDFGQPEGWTPHVAVGRVDGRMVAVAPMAVTRRRGIRLLEWAGVEVFDFQDVLADPALDQAPLWQAIRRSRGYDTARMRSMRSGTISRSHLDRFATKMLREDLNYAIELTQQSGERWLAALTSHMRTAYRYNLRRLQRIGLTQLRTAANLDDIATILPGLVSQKKAWAAKNGVDFDVDRSTKFFSDLARQALTDGVLHLSALECEGHPISTHLGFADCSDFYYYLCAYDTEWSRFSPGLLHTMMLVMWATDRGHSRFDFLRGAEDYKKRFGSPYKSQEYVFSRGIVGSVAEQLYIRRQVRVVEPA